jgi:hypothetical protein
LAANRARPLLRTAVDLADQIGIKNRLVSALYKSPATTFSKTRSVLDAFDERIRKIAAGTKPIVVGPWLSEVGFEVLYWVPLLRHVVEKYKIDPSRITVVSRGGCRNWYWGIARNYTDIFDILTPDEFKVLNEERWKENAGLQKHLSVGTFDRKLLSRLGFADDIALLHPELMYGLFNDYWSGSAGFERYSSNIRFTRLKRPEHAILESLPERYVAAKFYSRPSLPKDDQSVAFVAELVSRLAERTPVVLLHTGITADDHSEFPVPAHPNVRLLTGHLQANDNLAVQSAVISRAERVYCTYGGFAYLPLMYGVPAVGFYTVDKHFSKIHGRAAYYMASQMRAPLSIVETEAFRTLWSV